MIQWVAPLLSGRTAAAPAGAGARGTEALPGDKEDTMNRYGTGSRMVVGPTGRSNRRALQLIALILAAAVIVLLIVGIPALRYQGESRSYAVSRMRTECESALREVNTLSRTSASSSAAILSRIRSEVYAMSVLNQAQQALGGSPLVEESLFTDLFGTIERYFSTLMLSGTNTANLQTEMAQQLTALGERVNSLE